MTLRELYDLSGYLSGIGSLIIAACSLISFRSRPSYIKVLGLYAVTSIIFSLAQKLSEWFFGNVGLNAIGNTWTLFEALLLSLLFYNITKSTAFRKGIFVSAALYTIFYLITFLSFAEHSYSLIRFGRDFLVIFYSLAYFYYLIRELPEEDLLKTPMFWINSAVIFFFSGTLILSFMRDYIVNVLKDDLTGFWAFRNFFRFGFCLLLAYAGWLNWRSIKSKEAEIT
jgi:hypothetical protein